MKTPGRTSRNRLWNGYAGRSTHSGIVGDVDLLTPGEGKVAEDTVSSGAWLLAEMASIVERAGRGGSSDAALPLGSRRATPNSVEHAHLCTLAQWADGRHI